VHIARGYVGYGLPSAIWSGRQCRPDEGREALRPTMNVRLVSFAVHWIRAEIHEYVLRNWRLVKIATTKAQTQALFNLRRMKKNLSWLTHAETQAVARELGVEPSVVTEMEKRLAARDMSFDPAPDQDEDEPSVSPAMYLPSRKAIRRRWWSARNGRDGDRGSG